MAEAEYSISVRSLCEFTARSGDLSVRFTPAPTAQQGIAAHTLMAARRHEGYEREVTLQGRYGNLMVRGRADGYDPDGNRLEEFKSYRGDLALMPDNQRALHWAQLKIYGALLCRLRALAEIDLSLVYFDIKTGIETALTERSNAAELAAFFSAHCGRFLDWATQEARHRTLRREFLARVALPHAELRAGQREMAEAVYRAARAHRVLMTEAPTGSGKTIGSLFPLLKAWPALQLDKIFFLVAKTSGRMSALQALRSLAIPPTSAPLRVLELASKQSACRYPGRRCEGSSCPLAAGFFDRLPFARSAAMAHPVLDQATLRGLAEAAGICPYYLTQELTRWCDVIIGDYNYFFDTSAILHGLTLQNQWCVGLLVDEAHNLVGRARAMYSATLNPEVLEAASAAASQEVSSRIERLAQAWRSFSAGHREDYFATEIPVVLVPLLHDLIAAIGDEWVARSEVDDSLLRLYFDALHFCRLAEAFGSHSLFDISRTERGAVLCIRNVSPAPFLAQRFAVCTTAVLFSATLRPFEFYRRVLGLPADVVTAEVDSPFKALQLEVRIAPRISTRYRDRLRSLVPIANLMARQYRTRPGNYLAFFGSFAYLQAALKVFRSRFPHLPVWEQVRGMDATARESFLARFAPGGNGIGFAVLGGAFAEGIDLPGDRLIGAFIATLGFPQVNEVNAQIEGRMQQLFDAGYEYTYLYPGLQKVVQAAGRVIRTVSDRGTLHLMDDRYQGATVRALLPRWWHVESS